MKEILQINFNKICLICLKESAGLVPLTHKVTTCLNVEISILEIIKECSKYPSVHQDELPQHVCPQCSANCTSAYNFKQQTEESYVKLLRIVGKKLAELDSTTKTEEIAENSCKLDKEKFIDKTSLQRHCRVQDNTTLEDMEIVDLPKLSPLANDDNKIADDVDGDENPISIANNDDDNLMKPLQCVGTNAGVENVKQPDLKSPTATIEDKHACPQCPAIFKRSSHLSRHILKHNVFRLFPCTLCDKSFQRRDHLHNHIQNIHTEKQFRCLQCERTYARQCLLDQHVKRKHSRAAKPAKCHQCSSCGKEFTTKGYLAKHELSHLGLVCKRCNEAFKTVDSLKAHEAANTCLKRGHLCFMCGESFTRGDYLRIHMRRHTGEKPFMCQYCDKKFPRTSDLKMHERYHTNTKPNLCNLCGKSFHRAYNLKIHMRIHTGERPYQCNECSKTFTQSTDLKIHLRRHTGERYSCDVCDAAFLRHFALRNHYLSSHGIQIEAKTSRVQNTGQLASEPNAIVQMFTKCTEVPKSEEIATKTKMC